MRVSWSDLPAIDILVSGLADFQKSRPNFLFFAGVGECTAEEPLECDCGAGAGVVCEAMAGSFSWARDSSRFSVFWHPDMLFAVLLEERPVNQDDFFFMMLLALLWLAVLSVFLCFCEPV